LHQQQAAQAAYLGPYTYPHEMEMVETEMMHGYPAADMEDMGPLDMEQAGGAYQNHPLELEQQYTVKAGCGVGGAKREHAERALRGREGEGDAEGG
jgi:hypothetical protein